MFIKTLLALLVTMALAAAAVFFGAQQNVDLNETKLRPNTHQSGDNPNASPKFLDRFIKSKQVETLPIQTNTQGSVEHKYPFQTKKENFETYFAVLSEQAEQINMSNLKDQAYIDLVQFALVFDEFGAASEAMRNIDQVELRDTSRGQLAIAVARAGKIAEAFSIIDNVETDGLRDVLRLQVIESITLPQSMAPEIIQRIPRN